ncbi:unnamed protein product [Timema podura]|uniref:Uncharacterized protein n=1 Tax=Timema podura TaxID=61482 RepID=A0ABN7PU45_TIMPD|nr:unnamed protein product [Timema podura]
MVTISDKPLFTRLHVGLRRTQTNLTTTSYWRVGPILLLAAFCKCRAALCRIDEFWVSHLLLEARLKDPP